MTINEVYKKFLGVMSRNHETYRTLINDLTNCIPLTSLTSLPEQVQLPVRYFRNLSLDTTDDTMNLDNTQAIELTDILKEKSPKDVTEVIMEEINSVAGSNCQIFYIFLGVLQEIPKEITKYLLQKFNNQLRER